MRRTILALAGALVLILGIGGLPFLFQSTSPSAPKKLPCGNDGSPLGKKREFFVNSGRSSQIRAAAISGDGNWLVTAGKDMQAHLWDLGMGKSTSTSEAISPRYGPSLFPETAADS